MGGEGEAVAPSKQGAQAGAPSLWVCSPCLAICSPCLAIKLWARWLAWRVSALVATEGSSLSEDGLGSQLLAMICVHNAKPCWVLHVQSPGLGLRMAGPWHCAHVRVQVGTLWSSSSCVQLPKSFWKEKKYSVL